MRSRVTRSKWYSSWQYGGSAASKLPLMIGTRHTATITMSSPVISPDQITAIRFQIYAFKLLVEKATVPSLLLQYFTAATSTSGSVVSESDTVKDDPSAMINQKLHMNQGLIRCVPLFYTIHHHKLITYRPSDVAWSLVQILRISSRHLAYYNQTWCGLLMLQMGVRF
jgi:hypothetical protein